MSDDDLNDRPQLKCISCGYDLRGLPPEGRAQTAFQCPECGSVNEIKVILQEHDRRQRSTRDLINAALIGLLVTALVVVGRWLLAPAGIELSGVSIVLFLAVLGVCWLTVIGWYAVSHFSAAVFGLVTAVLVSAAVSMDVGRGGPTAILFLWVVGFINWAKTR